MSRGSLAVMIKKSSLIFDKYANQLLTPYNLSGSQFRILMKLYKSPDCSVRQTDIETDFSMTNPTVTGLINNLEKAGYVERVTNPDDKRSRLLKLTDYAHDRKDGFFELAATLENQMTAGLTETEVEILSVLLRKVVEHHKK